MHAWLMDRRRLFLLGASVYDVRTEGRGEEGMSRNILNLHTHCKWILRTERERKQSKKICEPRICIYGSPLHPRRGEMTEGNGGGLVRACGVRESKPNTFTWLQGFGRSLVVDTSHDSRGFPLLPNLQLSRLSDKDKKWKKVLCNIREVGWGWESTHTTIPLLSTPWFMLLRQS